MLLDGELVSSLFSLRSPFRFGELRSDLPEVLESPFRERKDAWSDVSLPDGDHSLERVVLVDVEHGVHDLGRGGKGGRAEVSDLIDFDLKWALTDLEPVART